MSIRLLAPTEAVARTCLAPSPIGEAVFSLRVLASPEPDHMHASVVDHVSAIPGEAQLAKMF